MAGGVRRYDFFPHFFSSLFQSQISGFATQAIWASPPHGLSCFVPAFAVVGDAVVAGFAPAWGSGVGGGAAFSGFLTGGPPTIFQASGWSHPTRLGLSGSPSRPIHPSLSTD